MASPSTVNICIWKPLFFSYNLATIFFNSSSVIVGVDNQMRVINYQVAIGNSISKANQTVTIPSGN